MTQQCRNHRYILYLHYPQSGFVVVALVVELVVHQVVVKTGCFSSCFVVAIPDGFLSLFWEKAETASKLRARSVSRSDSRHRSTPVSSSADSTSSSEGSIDVLEVSKRKNAATPTCTLYQISEEEEVESEVPGQ
mmetsp:Transcript_10859/g.26252  ORF Transcript_10859/g.26252 Transcript_10859/m.26252 type:complete len:134 (+) Transcript_10859:111-512(+)